MSGKVIYFTFFVLLSNVSFGQQFAPIGAKWHYDGTGGMMNCDSGGVSYDYYLYESIADTVVIGKNCRKITATYFQPCGFGTMFLSNEYMYSDSGKVYYYRYGKFNLLYDFTALAGDTISIVDPVYSACCNTDTISRIVIDSVKLMIDIITLPDSMYYGVDSLRVFFTHPVNIEDSTGIIEEGLTYRLPVIENIGSTSFFFPQKQTFINGEDGPLRCYSDLTKFFKVFPYSCDQWLDPNTGFSENLEPQLNFSIYPNPFVTNATIKIDKYNNENLTLKIYNVFGQILQTIQIKQSQTTLNRNNLTSGMYFYQLIDQEKILATGKFIIE